MTPVTVLRRRAHVAAFWIVALFLLALLSLAAALALDLPNPLIWPLGTVAIALAPGAVRDEWFDLVVRVWNRGTRILFRLLRRLTMRLAFRTIFVLLGRDELPLELRPHARTSMWRERPGRAAAGPVFQGTASTGWCRDLVRYARQTGNGSLLAVVPFVVTLMLLGEELEDTAPPTSTYTLY
jgi:hypothetical protein